MAKKIKQEQLFLVTKVAVFIIVMAVLIIFTNRNMQISVKACDPKQLSLPYAKWNFSTTADDIKDSKGIFTASLFDTRSVEGFSDKAKYFNGKNSYAKVPVDFKGWKSVSISLLVKPEKKHGNELSIILDNGHNPMNNFVVQTADENCPNNSKWVWHCNGIDIMFTMPFDKWSWLIVVADAAHGVSRVYINGKKAGEIKTGPFEFGANPLIIGKLALANKRYFKGSIDEIDIFDRTIEDKEVLENEL